MLPYRVNPGTHIVTGRASFSRRSVEPGTYPSAFAIIVAILQCGDWCWPSSKSAGSKVGNKRRSTAPGACGLPDARNHRERFPFVRSADL
jgi:hypothetical protein